MIKRLALALGFLLLVAPAVAHACTCLPPGPAPCAGLGKAAVIFVGTVIHIDHPPPEDPSADPNDDSTESIYEFRVDENIAGAGASALRVLSGRGGGDCSYHFKQGAQYLVFPFKDDDGYWATICSGTRPISNATALLPQLRAMRDAGRVASLFGVLRRAQQPYDGLEDPDFDSPLPDTVVKLESGKTTLTAMTDKHGVYAFFDAPGGEYQVSASLPPNLELAISVLDQPPEQIQLPSGACWEHDLEAMPTASIRGQVIGPDGKPLRYASVDLFRVGQYDESKFAWFESQHEYPFFEFKHVAPGDYLLVYNRENELTTDSPFPRTFYPGVSQLKDAKPVHVGPGQHLEGLQLRVSGGRPVRVITVRLIVAEGGIPDVAYLDGEGADGSMLSLEKIEPGVFRVTLFRGVKYTLHGEGFCSATNQEVKTAEVVVDGSGDRISEVVLLFPGTGCPKK